jgi:hypothetical protein
MKHLQRLTIAVLTAALLSACDNGNSGFASSTPTLVFRQVTARQLRAPLSAHSKTYNYEGVKQTFKVPRGVTRLMVAASAGDGSDGY